ncbi:MAG TPA: tetratricopeptide repeat protein [Longimicrobiales bacterium]|nr:tetratricopeptide repeat protein [Longimicrobiales bacterium]
MHQANRGPSARVWAPAFLVLGVVAATLAFLRAQPSPAAGPVAAPVGRSGAPADAAHDAAGVRPGGGGGDVAARFQQQVDALREQLAASPSDRLLVLRLAQLLHDGHRVPDAVPLYRRAMELDPSDPQPYYDLAAAHAGLGDWDAAGAVLEERLAREPGDAVALYDLGVVRANQGRTEEAQVRLQQALDASSDGALRARISEALARLKGP